MIGVVVVAHGKLAHELMSTAELILGPQENFTAVSLHADWEVDEARKALKKAIGKVDQGKGVLLLTDLFGGTPSNLCLSFLEDDNIEVVSGVNLPMLIKLPSFTDKHDLGEVAKLIMEYGKRNISVASRRLYEEKT
ncbi:MAG: PTS sugar transporter subunit IIA [bacterium]|jgi:PTS system mannose-specific IIA component|nr:PTS sugar transporter subunit IIA [bacterium]